MKPVQIASFDNDQHQQLIYILSAASPAFELLLWPVN